MKRLFEDIGFDSLPTKHFHRSVTCLLDLPDEILLLICRYMSLADILRSFYTPERPEMRLHRVIFDYYTKMKMSGMTSDEYSYLYKLFCDSKTSLRPHSLILNNEQVSYLIKRFFFDLNTNTIQSIFTNLRHLTLIDCSPKELDTIGRYFRNSTQLEYLHITIREFDRNMDKYYLASFNTRINQLLFGKQLNSLEKVIIQAIDGLVLYKSLIPHENLRHVDINLQTMDDLYVLLSGLLPNVKTMIVELRQARLLNCRRPLCKSYYPQLTEFTLLDPQIGLVFDDIKYILNYMPNLIQFTLSIRDTPDPIFCHGHKFESMLSEHLPHLRRFHYTMTHRINNRTLIEDFIQYSMNVTFYADERSKWIHIYSLPWPANREDKRQLPIVKDESVTSEVKRAECMDHVVITKHEEFILLNTRFLSARQITSCLAIDIKLPLRISKVILSKETSVSSINSIIQPSIRHLIVERRLNDEHEIPIFARQFPHLKYLELLFPLESCPFVNCFKSLFGIDDKKEKRCYWPQLINFCTSVAYKDLDLIWSDSNLHLWLIQNTDLKYNPLSFHAHRSYSMLSIWF